MAKRFTQVKLDAFKEIQIEAGVIVKDFDPSNPILDRSKIICTTSGGVTITAKPSFTDYFEDVDNVPNNTMEGKQVDDWECTFSTNMLDVYPEGVKLGLGVADIDANDSTRVTPRRDINLSDFEDSIWFVGDRADGGFIAVQILNALSTEGFALQTTKKGKGTTPLTLMGHYSMNAVDTVPMNFYIVEGSGSETPSLTLDKSSLTVQENNSATITPTTNPAAETVTWQSLNTAVATVTSGGVVTGEAEGSTIIVASFNKDDVTYSAFCNVTVTGEAEG